MGSGAPHLTSLDSANDKGYTVQVSSVMLAGVLPHPSNCCCSLAAVLHAVPGVDKIPNFEEVFVQFLQAACSSNGISSPSAGHVAAHS